MKNLNIQNSLLLSEIKKLNITNSKFVTFSGSAQASAEDYLTKITEASVLPEDLIDFSFQVEERVSAQEVLTDYFKSAKSAYMWTFKSPQYPDWMLEQKTDEENFAEFFINIGSIESIDFKQILEYSSHSTIELMRGEYDSWKELKQKESMKKDQVAIVQHAIDARFLLKATLRSFGYWPKDIAVVTA